MSPPSPLAGRAVLVVEDDYLVATALARALGERGATVVGPAPDVRRALDLLARAPRVDGAIVDVDLRGERVFPVAEALRARGIPFVFATGFDCDVVADRYEAVPLHEKPIDLERVAAALFGSAGDGDARPVAVVPGAGERP